MQPRETKLVPVASDGESPFSALVIVGFSERQGETGGIAHLGEALIFLAIVLLGQMLVQHRLPMGVRAEDLFGGIAGI